nr:site-specific integrase [Azospirillum argentinense]
MHHDGHGLYLQVTETGKSWVYRYTLHGRSREMGLGPFHTISLKEAREKAAACRKLKLEGIDPLEHRNREIAESRLQAASAVTFKDAADQFIKAHKASWRNPKHAEQWPSTLNSYVYPVFGDISVQAVDVGLVMKVLESIWTTKAETASRVRGRIETILDWATAHGHRTGENPARWRGHLENLLPKRSKVQRVEHHAALPYREIAGFMAALRKQEGVAASALEFLILTASRTGETIGATWDEVDLEHAVWTIPANRIKMAKEHRVPLSASALAVLERVKKLGTEGFVFPGGKTKRPLSNMAMAKLLERMGRDDITVHGFRSTFRDWAADQTNAPREVAEMALAHAISDKVEAAYRRGNLFEKRQKLMEEWATVCDGKPETYAAPQ